MTPESRAGLIRTLVSIVKAPMNERVRVDRLASACFMFHMREGDSSIGTEDSVWTNEIWPEVMKATGCQPWAEIVGASKTMPSMEKH